MPIFSPASRRRVAPSLSRAPALLATTSIAALLLGGTAHAGNITVTGQTQAGFGALTVNATSSNSFQTTLGVRLTGRMVIGNVGTFIPELRVGWNHEFLDTSQTITAALIGVPGSSFSSAGLAFGRDAALIGAGLSLELSPDAKVFVDYDGRIGSRLQEHSVSGGLKVRF